MSKIGVKVKGRGQGPGSRSWVKVKCHGKILGAWLCRVQQRAKKSHHQSEVFVCVLNNRTDAADRLLISSINPNQNTEIISILNMQVNFPSLAYRHFIFGCNRALSKEFINLVIIPKIWAAFLHHEK